MKWLDSSLGPEQWHKVPRHPPDRTENHVLPVSDELDELLVDLEDAV